jgi:hypothetical protein
VAKKNTSEVADHAADLSGKVVWQLPDNISLWPVISDFRKHLKKSKINLEYKCI